MSGFNKLLNELVKRPMGEQHKKYDQELIKWMGENPQMDDILLIGFEYDS